MSAPSARQGFASRSAPTPHLSVAVFSLPNSWNKSDGTSFLELPLCSMTKASAAVVLLSVGCPAMMAKKTPTPVLSNKFKTSLEVLIAVAGTAAILAACGGGGGGGGGGQDPAPRVAEFPAEPVADRIWQTPQRIEIDAGDAWLPRIAIDNAGNALAVWQQFDGTRFNIWSNRYITGSGWQAAQLVETSNAGSAFSAQIAIEGSGNAHAVWGQSNGTRYSIWSSRYVVGSGWQTAQVIEADEAGNAYYPQIAIDSAGNALAVWQQSDGTRLNIWSNRYVVGSGWQTAQLIEADNASDANYPQIAIDSAGNALAVWQQSDGTRYNIWSNRYVVGSGWQTAQLIEADNAGDGRQPQIAIEGSGNAHAVWTQFDGTRYSIWSSRYLAGSGWQTAQLIEADNASDANYPQIAIDSAGNALAVWQQTHYSIWSSRYVVGSGWQTAQVIEAEEAGVADYPQIAIDSAGNALAVWQQFDGTRYNIWSNRYVVGSGWQTAQLIEADNAGNANYPRIAIDSVGNAHAVWQQSGSVWTNRWN